MVSATLDVNVLVSATIMRHGIPHRLLEAWHAQRFAVVASQHIIMRVALTLRSDKLRRYRVTSADIRTLQASLRADATLVDVPASAILPVTGDSEDDAVLATARLGQADYLVTGDRGLLDRSPYEGIQIVTPRTFLELLNR